jgi:hypothetical protein
MINLLIRLMLLASLAQLGLNLPHLSECRSRGCIAQLERASHEVLKIDWRPIIFFPEEAQRFR